MLEHVNVSLHSDERDAIALFHDGKADFIIIDDGKGSSFCRERKIPYMNALFSVKYFICVSRLIMMNSWRWLLSNGRYSQKVITWAENADEKDLLCFL